MSITQLEAAKAASVLAAAFDELQQPHQRKEVDAYNEIVCSFLDAGVSFEAPFIDPLQGFIEALLTRKNIVIPGNDIEVDLQDRSDDQWLVRIHYAELRRGRDVQRFISLPVPGDISEVLTSWDNGTLGHVISSDVAYRAGVEVDDERDVA